MDNLETRMKIDNIINDADNRMNEIFDINVNSPNEKIYQTFALVKDDQRSFFYGYINYYMGVFEGILLTLFLEEFDAYPTIEQQEFISDSFKKKWEKFVDKCKKYAIIDYKNLKDSENS